MQRMTASEYYKKFGINPSIATKTGGQKEIHRRMKLSEYQQLLQKSSQEEFVEKKPGIISKTGTFFKEVGKDIIGSSVAMGVDILRPPTKSRPKSITMFGKEYLTPSGAGKKGGQLFKEGKYKEGLGVIGSSALDVITLGYGGAVRAGQKVAQKMIEKGVPKLISKATGTGIATAPIGGAYGVTGEMKEGATTKDILIGGAKGLGGGFLVGTTGDVAIRSTGTGLSKVMDKKRREALKEAEKTIDITTKETIDEFEKKLGTFVNEEQANAIRNAISQGKTKQDIVKEVTFANNNILYHVISDTKDPAVIKNTLLKMVEKEDADILTIALKDIDDPIKVKQIVEPKLIENKVKKDLAEFALAQTEAQQKAIVRKYASGKEAETVTSVLKELEPEKQESFLQELIVKKEQKAVEITPKTEGAIEPIKPEAKKVETPQEVPTEKPVQIPQVDIKLPRELAGAKPRYNYGRKALIPKFESDIDKALFITSQKTPSKKNEDYLAFLRKAGLSDEEIKIGGQLVRDKIKSIAKDAEPGEIIIEKTFKRIIKNVEKKETPKKSSNPKKTSAPKSKAVETPKEAPKPKAEPKAEVKKEVKTEKPTVRELKGTGKLRERSVSKKGRALAIEEGLEGLKDDKQMYRQYRRKGDIEAYTEKIETNKDDVLKIALGEKEPLEGMTPEGAYIALEKTATKEVDVETIEDLLYNSSLVEEATVMGQRISMWAERNPFSPVKIIKDIIDNKFAKKGMDKKTAVKELNDFKKKMQKDIEFKIQDARDILNGLICK